jgi:ankyrin repeat protein
MNGWTAMHIAASKGLIEIAELLLSCGHLIDIEARTDMRRTPLHWASNFGHIEVIELLLEAGADTNALDDDGNSALHLAAQNGHAAAANLLVLANADMLLQNFAGKVPAELASNIDVATLLSQFARRRQLETHDNFSRVPFCNVLLRNSRADSVSKLLTRAARPPNPEEIKKL